MTETITISEAARRLGVEPSTLRKRCRTGRTVAHKSGGTWLIEWPLVTPPLPRPRLARRGPLDNQSSL